MLKKQQVKIQIVTASEKYFSDIEELPVDDLIKIMEQKAYSMARCGQNLAVNAMFVAVAALEQTKNVSTIT